MNENTNDVQKEIESVLENDEAYGSNVNILNYSSTPTKITGKFKDSWNNRVFDFTIDEDGVGYKPSVNLDSVPVENQEGRFDSFSDGYLSGIRADGKLTGKRTKKPKCGGTSFGCGYSCVGLTKVCRITVGRKKLTANQGSNVSKERISKLLEMASKPGVDPKFQAHHARASTARTVAEQSGRRRSMMRGKPAEAAEIAKPKEAATTQKKALTAAKAKSTTSEPDGYDTSNPKIHSIKSEKDVTNLALILNKTGETIRIADLRRTLGETVSRENFNKHLIKAQADGLIQFIEGSSRDVDGSEEVQDMIATKVNGLRAHYKLTTDGKAALSKISKTDEKQLLDKIKDPPDLDPLGGARAFAKGAKLTNQSDFDKEIDKVHDVLNKEFNYDNSVPITKIRDVLKNRIPPEDFNKFILQSEKYTTKGHSVPRGQDENNIPTEIRRGAVTSRINGERHYLSKD